MFPSLAFPKVISPELLEHFHLYLPHSNCYVEDSFHLLVIHRWVVKHFATAHSRDLFFVLGITHRSISWLVHHWHQVHSLTQSVRSSYHSSDNILLGLHISAGVIIYLFIWLQFHLQCDWLITYDFTKEFVQCSILVYLFSFLVISNKVWIAVQCVIDRVCNSNENNL